MSGQLRDHPTASVSGIVAMSVVDRASKGGSDAMCCTLTAGGSLTPWRACTPASRRALESPSTQTRRAARYASRLISAPTRGFCEDITTRYSSRLTVWRSNAAGSSAGVMARSTDPRVSRSSRSSPRNAVTARRARGAPSAIASPIAGSQPISPSSESAMRKVRSEVRGSKPVTAAMVRSITDMPSWSSG